jgi:hypothetical protein
MAKRRGSTALAPRVQVVAVSAPRRSGGRLRRAAGAVRRHVKRGGVALAKGAWEEKTAIAAVGGAGVVGYLEGSGMLEVIPDFGIGRIPTLALGTYFAGRAFKSTKLRHAGIGLAAAAAFGFGLDHGRKSKK